MHSFTYNKINSCQSNLKILREEVSTTSRKIPPIQWFSVHRNQAFQSWSKTLPLQRRETHQGNPCLSQSRLPRYHRLRKSTQTLIQGCVIHSRSNSNQYFNFHFMYGGFKKWVVDRYFVGSLYRNGFRVMWFPALVFYVCTHCLTKSAAITCVSMTMLLMTSSTFQIEMIKHKLSIIIVRYSWGL